MRELVVDASVVAKWFVPEVHSPAAVRLLENDQVTFYAPDLLLTELASVMWKKTQRKEITVTEARTIVTAFDQMPVGIVSTAPLTAPAFEIAVALNQTVYDATYLAVAIARDTRVVTADNRLHRAISASRLAKHIAWIEDEL